MRLSVNARRVGRASQGDAAASRQRSPDARHTHRQLDGARREVGQAFSNGCRYPGDPQARGAEIYNCRCTLAAAIDGVDASDGERWSKLPPGMTYQQWKDELAPKGSDCAQGSAAVGEVVKSKVAAVSGRAKRAVNAYIEAQRVFGLTAPGFSPRPRKTVQLPKAEYARVQSAIATNYSGRFAGKSSGSMAVGVTFTVSRSKSKACTAS